MIVLSVLLIGWRCLCSLLAETVTKDSYVGRASFTHTPPTAILYLHAPYHLIEYIIAGVSYLCKMNMPVAAAIAKSGTRRSSVAHHHVCHHSGDVRDDIEDGQDRAVSSSSREEGASYHKFANANLPSRRQQTFGQWLLPRRGPTVFVACLLMVMNFVASKFPVDRQSFVPPANTATRYSSIINAANDVSVSSGDEKSNAHHVGDKSGEKMTVLISTFKQPKCLQRLVRHLQTCVSIVDNIRINWFEDSPIPQSLVNNGQFKIPVTFDMLPNNLSHRFLPRDFHTEAVFSMDVDMVYSCEALQLTMDTWRNHSNHTHIAIGFFPRHLPCDKYYTWDESHREPYKRNTLFITKGGLLHRDRFEDYFHPLGHS